MPLQVPSIDDRRYQDLVDEALARIPVHNPAWTNFNDADPGVTLIQLFAFLTENLLYRANQIPERNRRKFLSLLGIPLRPATSARGLVQFGNERGPLETITLGSGLEVDAGQVPFRTTAGLDVLPVEGRVFYKRALPNPPPEIAAYYRQLYASYAGEAPTDFTLYETVPLTLPGPAAEQKGVNLSGETVDSSLWIALLARPGDLPPGSPAAGEDPLRPVREALGGKTVNLGVVPALSEAEGVLGSVGPGAAGAGTGQPLLRFEIPAVPPDGRLATDRLPRYRPLDALPSGDVLTAPGVVQLTLPAAGDLRLWADLEPLEPGTGDFPPTLEDTNLNRRLVTWLRLRLPAGLPGQPGRAAAPAEGAGVSAVKLLWVGINTALVTQRAHVANETLPPGTGEPDQEATLARPPVIPGSVRLWVTSQGRTAEWAATDDLLSAGPEVPARDPRLPPGASAARPAPAEVFTLDPEGGVIRFGDGLRGKRPPFGAQLRATYDYGVGRAGNVGAGAISTGPTLPASIAVANPVPTWGGADAETVREGERQITRYLQHRDRLVTAEDWRLLARRTPGVELGRVEVIPAYNPDLAPNEPGDAPGAVTLLVIPRYDPVQPDAPRPDRLFLNQICTYLDPRRLITTEVFLRGPKYKGIWISIGINVAAGASVAEVRETVKRGVLDFLSPLPTLPEADRENPAVLAALPPGSHAAEGWPLRTPVLKLQLWAVASRPAGVSLVNDVLLAEGLGPSAERIEMTGLELPRVLGIAVTPGEPLALDQLRGQTPSGPPGGDGTGGDGGDGRGRRLVPVPVIPEECR